MNHIWCPVLTAQDVSMQCHSEVQCVDAVWGRAHASLRQPCFYQYEAHWSTVVMTDFIIYLNQWLVFSWVMHWVFIFFLSPSISCILSNSLVFLFCAFCFICLFIIDILQSKYILFSVSFFSNIWMPIVLGQSLLYTNSRMVFLCWSHRNKSRKLQCL